MSFMTTVIVQNLTTGKGSEWTDGREVKHEVRAIVHEGITQKDFDLLKSMALGADGTHLREEGLKQLYAASQYDRKNSEVYQEIFKVAAASDPIPSVRKMATELVTEVAFLEERIRTDSNILVKDLAKAVLRQLKRGEEWVPEWIF